MILALGCSPWPSAHWRNLFLLSWLIYYLWNIHDFKFQLRLVWLPVIFMFKVRLIPCIQQWGICWKSTFPPSSSRKKYMKLKVWDAAGPSIPCNYSDVQESPDSAKLFTKKKKNGIRFQFLSVWLHHLWLWKGEALQAPPESILPSEQDNTFLQDPETSWRVWGWTSLTHRLLNGCCVAFRSLIN